MMAKKQVENALQQTFGGAGGHWMRRGIHVSLVGIPWVYYWHGDTVAAFLNGLVALGWTPGRIGSVLIIGIMLQEVARLHWQVRFPGYRDYELQRVSSMAWGTVGIGITMLIAPTDGAHPAAYGLPVVATMSFADPVMGELRRLGAADKVSTAAGLSVALLIWVLSALLVGTPWLLVLLAPPIAIVAERANLDWMDDNAAMLLAPLALALILHPWF